MSFHRNRKVKHKHIHTKKKINKKNFKDIFYISKGCSEAGQIMVSYSCNSNTRLRQEDYHEYETNLSYTVSSGSILATE